VIADGLTDERTVHVAIEAQESVTLIEPANSQVVYVPQYDPRVDPSALKAAPESSPSRR
jgi:hypothetical protein